MEGVLVSAKRAGSKITLTVVSDEHGQYSFPRNRLDPGQYSVRIRAVGYVSQLLIHARIRNRALPAISTN